MKATLRVESAKRPRKSGNPDQSEGPTVRVWQL